MEYIEEVQKQLEVVVVVKEEKIKAGRRCSATLKCSAFNPVCDQDGGINKLLTHSGENLHECTECKKS